MVAGGSGGISGHSCRRRQQVGRLDRDERLVDRVDRTLHAGGQHFGVEPVDCALNPTDQIIPPAAVLSAAVLSLFIIGLGANYKP